MRIRMITSLAGPEGVADAGKIVECAPARAKELLDGGYARELEPGEGAKEVAVCTLGEIATESGRGRPKPKAAEKP